MNQEETRVGDDVRIIWGNVRLIMPALDCNPEDVLLLTVPMPGIRTGYNRKGNEEEKGEMVLCTITDKPEIFETAQQEFMKRGWLAHIPNPILEQRWDAQSIKALVEGRAPHVNPWDVYQAVRSKFEYYIDFGTAKYAETVCAVYCLASYFFFLFEYCPYLKFGGEKGSAKTKTGNIFAALGFNGQIFASASKASIYRTAQDTRGMMVIDEGEALAYKSEEQAAYQQVLNSGWQRNGYAILTDKETLRPTKWSTYSPKVICSIGGLEEVLGDRTFETILLKTLSREKAERDVSLTSKEWQPIRDMEYLCLFQHWKEVQILIPTVENPFDFSGRIWALAKLLIVLAKFIDQYRPEGAASVESEVQEFIKQQAKDKVVKAAESFASSVLTILREDVKAALKSGTLDETSDLYFRVELNELTNRVKEAEGFEKLSPKTVARTLINLELYKDVKRDGKHGERRFGVRPSDLARAEKRILGSSDISEKSADGTDATEVTDGGKHTPESLDGQFDGKSGQGGVSLSASASAVTSVPSVARDSPNESSVSPSVSSVETGICAVCGRDGGKAKVSPGTGIIYLHPGCERSWEGKL